ncbi:hypothetical protein FB446DRAFT_449637 [Lentinula raphanica]|nr:hypothetical protein FB446DRAFT_449637 [Lentinula raphanica]
MIGSQPLIGNIPNVSLTGTVIRQIDDVDSAKGTSNAFLNCGQSAQLPSDVVQANSGDTAAFTCVNGDDGPHWSSANLHDLLRLRNLFLLRSSSAYWFKIREQGCITLMNSGAPMNLTILADIALVTTSSGHARAYCAPDRSY